MTKFVQVGKHGIYIPKYQDLYASMGARIALEGRFKLTTHSRRYGSRVRAEFKNLILNQGLDRVGQGAWISHCQVGTGSSTPNAAQTSLDAPIAGSNTAPIADVNTYVPGPPPYRTLVRTRRFAEGVATGNISEVGMGWGESGPVLFSRALILDGDGNPTTITVLSDETLDVEYTLYVYPPTADTTGTITLAGVDYDYTMRTADIGGTAWNTSSLVAGAVCSNESGGGSQIYPASTTLGDITTSPSGGATLGTTMVAKTYTPGSYSRGVTVTFGLSANPAGGVGAAAFNMGSPTGGARCKVGFSPAIPKDGTKILVLEPSISWARH